MKPKAVSLALLALLVAGGAQADRSSVNGKSASAELEFIIEMDKFIFFRVGTNADGIVDTVSLNAIPTIPPGAVVAVPGNNTTVNWGGTVPPFAVTATTLPVEVRSNAGQIRIWASVTSPLTSGINTIPMSDIGLTSSDPGSFPAPPLPASGADPISSVNVAGTAWSNLVTERSANWTFSYNPPVLPPAGVYNGVVTFTASSP